MPDIYTGDTATDAMKQTIVANMLQRQLIAKSVLAGTIRNVSEFAVDGVDEIEFPRTNNFSVVKKTSGTAVEAAALTYGTDKLLLDQHAVIQWLLEKKANKQSAINLEAANLLNATLAHAKGVDVDIHAALIAGVSASGPDHIIAFANASSLGRADIVEGMKLLDLQEMPDENRFLAVNPTEHAALLNITDFVDVSKYGSTAPVMNGELGQLFGMKVLKSTVVTAGRPIIYQAEACVLGFQLQPTFASQPDLANLATRYSVDQLYGVKVMQSGKGIVRLGAAS